jgi:3-dehydroquinate dehydratase/shikimate dehydrogenase
LLCVPIFVNSVAQAHRDAALAAEAGAELIEFRIDQFNPLADPGLVANSPLPCIVTCRSKAEGGKCELTDEQRLEILRRQLEFGASYADIELATYRDQKPSLSTTGRVILSSHDFTGRPERLYNILTELNESPADVAKIVWQARTIRDNIEVFEILQSRHKPTIALCMGEAGLISRVLAKKFGAFLTFASLQNDSATAPGQITIEQMKRLYRWDAIDSQTKVFGVVASPVMHSMSPAVHNAAFEETGFNGVYLSMLVNPGYESFKAFMESFLAFAPLDLSGLSITIPHKENALKYLQEKQAAIEPLAATIGAVNTITIQRADGNLQLAGSNTDYAAILDAITSNLNISRDQLKEYRVAVIGAGGTGRTAVAALASCGATVAIYNRTRDRADALAAEFTNRTGKVVAAPMERLCDSCCQIYINTTSVGMHPNVDANPFGDAPPKLTNSNVVFDTVYNPMRTKLLWQAEAVGAQTIGGVEMFVRQAAAQFTTWTQLVAPAQTMRQVIEARLQQSGSK